MRVRRLTVRTRLAVTFTAVFLAAGAALIALTVSLASQSIDRANAANAPAERALQSTFRDILAATVPSPGASGAAPGSPSATAPSTGKPTALSSADAGVKQKLLEANRAYSAATGSSAVDRMITWSLVGAAVLIPVSALLGWWLAGRALRPVRAVTAAARRVSDTTLSERLNVVGPRDEITELATTFDAMMGRLETAFDAQRRFVANASH
jgi:methyl-accepting chemotaxis protein